MPGRNSILASAESVFAFSPITPSARTHLARHSSLSLFIMSLSPFFSLFTSPPVLFLSSRCTVISLLDKTRRLTLYLHTFSPEFFRVPFQYERLHQSCISRFLGPATRYIHLQPPNGWLLFLISLIDLFHLLPRPVRFDRLWNHRNSPSRTRWFRNASPDYRTKRRNDIVRTITRHDTCYSLDFQRNITPGCIELRSRTNRVQGRSILLQLQPVTGYTLFDRLTYHRFGAFCARSSTKKLLSRYVSIKKRVR